MGNNFLNGSKPDPTEYGLSENVTSISWFNSSRNPAIDSGIAPGPYRELLPCTDLCYELVRSCPAAMSFSCPMQAKLFNRSYGVFDIPTFAQTGTWTCNFLGIDPPATASALRMEWNVIGLMILGMVHLVVFGL